MHTFVWVTSHFAGYHRWKDAPEKVAFLRDWHRHVFHVKLSVRVEHADRAIEFFILKEKLDNVLQTEFNQQRFEYSCESIALKIIELMKADEGVDVAMCEVSEDNENGATVVVKNA
jgi:hypothetical protein